MSRPSLPKFRADIQVVVDVSAADYDEAVAKLAEVAREIERRLVGKTTFERLPGRPHVVYAQALSPSED